MHVTQQPRLFYGWIIVAVACITVGISMGLVLSLGVFVEPFETTFGWGRGPIGEGILYGWITYGAFSLIFGFLSDRVGLRRIVLVGGLMFGIGLLALSRMQTLWQFYLFHGMLIGGGVGAFLVPMTSAVTRWFTRYRGLVVAIVNSGSGLGSMVFGRLTRSLLMLTDWRTTLLIYGLLVFAVLLPLAWLIRNQPQDMGLEPYGGVEPQSMPAGGSLGGYSFTAVLSTPAFWLIALMHMLCCMAHSGPLFHMVSHMLDHGVEKLAAATIFALAGFASIPGRIGTGLLAERYGSKPMLVFWLISQAATIVLYRVVEAQLSFTLLALWFGVSYGSVMPLYAMVTREFFGPRVMGTSYGAIFFLSCLGMGIGAWVGGRLFDSFGT
ncbi:MAG: MFS transporter, partial [Candidatus Tectomicrobia bacterium]|nr:MFS transporter [Candidatus Tectomicrobia bacterium]